MEVTILITHVSYYYLIRSHWMNKIKYFVSIRKSDPYFFFFFYHSPLVNPFHSLVCLLLNNEFVI